MKLQNEFLKSELLNAEKRINQQQESFKNVKFNKTILFYLKLSNQKIMEISKNLNETENLKNELFKDKVNFYQFHQVQCIF